MSIIMNTRREEIMARGNKHSPDTIAESYEKLEKAVDLHQKALDDLVSMNSLFTAAVFVGLAFASSMQRNIRGTEHCEAGNHVARRLVKYEVISFACYLLSSLVAKALKTHLFIYLIQKPDASKIKTMSSKTLRWFLFALSMSTSVIGDVLLLLSMIDIIQLRLGKVACEGTETSNAVGLLIAVNTLALLIYVPFVAYAIGKFTKIFDKLD